MLWPPVPSSLKEGCYPKSSYQNFFSFSASSRPRDSKLSLPSREEKKAGLGRFRGVSDSLIKEHPIQAPALRKQKHATESKAFLCPELTSSLEFLISLLTVGEYRCQGPWASEVSRNIFNQVFPLAISLHSHGPLKGNLQ